MNKITNRLKRMNWKGIVSAVLSVVLIVGAVAGVAALFGKDTKTIGASAFKVGTVDSKGIHKEDNRSIYTKDLIECQGLMIEPDFESSGTYQVFYYNESKAFIAATDLMKTSEGTYAKKNSYPQAKYCRIVITPAVPVDDNGAEDLDFKIHWYDVASYANKFNITVSKDQRMNLPDLFKYGEHRENFDLQVDSSNNYIEVEQEGRAFMYVSVEGYSKLTITGVDESNVEDITVILTNANGISTKEGILYADAGTAIVDVPEDAVYLYVIYDMADTYVIK